MEKINNLKKFGRLVSVLSSGVVILSGCGVNVDVNLEIDDANNMANISLSDDMINEATVTDNLVSNNVPVTSSVESTVSNIESTIINDEVVTYDFNQPLAVDSVSFDSNNVNFASDNDQINNLVGKVGTYSYVETFYDYKINEGDTLDSIASALSTSKSELMVINNLSSEDLTGISILKYPVREEYYNLAAGTDLSEVSELSGVDVNVISELNGISANDTKISKDSSILLHVFNGEDNRYMSNKGWVNVIYNNRIIGDKVVYANGFSGACNNVLVLSRLNDEVDSNVVLYYSFDGSSNYDLKVICLNAKDIDLVNGIPVAYFRSLDDMIEIAERNDEVIDDDFINKASTVNTASYQLNCDQNNNSYVTYNNIVLEDNEIKSNFSRSYHSDTTGKYVYLDTVASYPVNDNDTVLGICDKFNMDLDIFSELNPGMVKVKNGDSIYYPIKVEFYVAEEGEDINSIAAINGIDSNSIKNYSSDGVHVDNSGLICLHVFYNGETSYDNNIGVSNVINNNKIYGNEYVFASGYSGAANNLLVLNNEKFVSGTNSVTYYHFDSSDNYAATPVCLNASSIGSIDGIPVAYIRTEEDIYEIATSMGLTVDDSLLMQLSTSYGNNAIVGTDLEGRKFVTYDEKLLFSNNVTIEGNVKVK